MTLSLLIKAVFVKAHSQRECVCLQQRTGGFSICKILNEIKLNLQKEALNIGNFLHLFDAICCSYGGIIFGFISTSIVRLAHPPNNFERGVYKSQP